MITVSNRLSGNLMKHSGRAGARSKQLLCDTVENMNNNIVQKINTVVECLTLFAQTASDSDKSVASTIAKCTALKTDATTLLRRYRMSSATILDLYYRGAPDAPEKYYRHLSANGILTEIDQLIISCKSLIVHAAGAIKSTDKFMSMLECAGNLTTSTPLKTKNIEICKCGTKMMQIPEFSEIKCPNEACGRVKTLIGVQFRDANTDENTRAKHGGYDHSRHFKFWFDRLQAREAFTPVQTDLDNINYVINRDGYERTLLSCDDMRKILRDPKVGASRLNDHVVLLLVRCGGRCPPRFTFQEETSLAMAFDRVMSLYPDGGNKPYYPGLIGRIVLWRFRDDPEKLRLLNYIHVQSCDTEIKNDRIYKGICEQSDPSDDLKFVPFDPARRR